jgi:release factor glutamine methyltransferase
VGIEDAVIEAEVILRRAMGVDRTKFFASLDDELSPDALRRVDGLLRRRRAREPLAYILGSREFYGLDIATNPSVLVPRPETELLVDRALDFAGGRRDPVIADVGTGSGAIAVAIAARLPRATVYATDVSAAALRVADVNRRRHHVADRVHLCRGDLLEALPEPVDAIVSNPPYLTTSEMASVAAEVRREPATALHGGTEGLDVIARLLPQVPSRLRAGGLLLIEIAPDQLQAVVRMGKREFPSARVSFHRDLAGRPRVVGVESPALGLPDGAAPSTLPAAVLATDGGGSSPSI